MCSLNFSGSEVAPDVKCTRSIRTKMEVVLDLLVKFAPVSRPRVDLLAGVICGNARLRGCFRTT